LIFLLKNFHCDSYLGFSSLPTFSTRHPVSIGSKSSECEQYHCRDFWISGSVPCVP
jgi:hypothetical protein